MQTDIVKILEFVAKHENSAFFYTPLKVGNEKSYLFKNCAKSLICNKKSEIINSLNEIDELSKFYEFAYGSISYETGYIFEDKLKSFLTETDNNFINFHFFEADEVEIIPTKMIKFNHLQKLMNENYEINNLKLNENQLQYEAKIEQIRNYIANGDTYQVNYTLKAKFDFGGKVENMVANLLFNQSAFYTTIINEKDKFIISISPELFFKTEGNKIISKPMKGTIKRGNDLNDDFAKSEYLRNSEKDKAENIMIVDLLRNDIGKLSKFNTISAFPLFEIEKYETLYQMTSTVFGELSDKSFSKIVQNLFPCGSITGAPKIRTIEIIHELENENRGIYTGTIGIIQKNDFTFNIPIRTILLDKISQKGELGLGSGIIWDSNPKLEYEEVKLKSEFLVNSNKYFELIETMLIENGKIFLMENHINRLKKSADYFLFYFNEKELRNKLDSIMLELNPQKMFKLKLLLTKWGEIKFSLEKISEHKKYGKIAISKMKIDSKNKFQYFKTTKRKLYNSEFTKWQKNGFDDVIFVNENNFVVEGAISNIMIEINNEMITPPIKEGLLPGCYREYLISNKKVIEKSFGIDELLNANRVFIFNSVRKEIEIKEIYN